MVARKTVYFFCDMKHADTHTSVCNLCRDNPLGETKKTRATAFKNFPGQCYEEDNHGN